jgi:hypothetical protein
VSDSAILAGSAILTEENCVRNVILRIRLVTQGITTSGILIGFLYKTHIYIIFLLLLLHVERERER